MWDDKSYIYQSSMNALVESSESDHRYFLNDIFSGFEHSKMGCNFIEHIPKVRLKERYV